MSPPRLKPKKKKKAPEPQCRYKDYLGKPTTKLLVVGLDAALRNFGVVCLDQKGAVEHSHTYVNKAPTKSESRKRSSDYGNVIHPIHHLISNYVLYHKYQVVVAREDYAFSASSASDATLKELGGILYWELAKIPGVELRYIPIQSAKKWATGNGNAQKEDVIKGVRDNFGFSAGSEHEADAFAVASLTLALMKPGLYKKTEKQKQALVGLRDHPLTSVVL